MEEKPTFVITAVIMILMRTIDRESVKSVGIDFTLSNLKSKKINYLKNLGGKTIGGIKNDT